MRLRSLPVDVKIIPGHGQVSNLDDVRAYVKMLKETRAAVQDALDKKMTLEQMKEKKVLDPWKKYSGEFVIGRRISGDVVQLAYRAEEREVYQA